jgi:hypothetical protein
MVLSSGILGKGAAAEDLWGFIIIIIITIIITYSN